MGDIAVSYLIHAIRTSLTKALIEFQDEQQDVQIEHGRKTTEKVPRLKTAGIPTRTKEGAPWGGARVLSNRPAHGRPSTASLHRVVGELRGQALSQSRAGLFVVVARGSFGQTSTRRPRPSSGIANLPHRLPRGTI